VELAARSGADAVKFQTFEASEISALNVRIPRGYDEEHDAWLDRHGVTYLHELLSNGGLPRQWHNRLKAEAENMGIEFISTPFSVDAAKFLVEEIGLDKIKIASGDITFYPMMDYLDGAKEVDIIVSTGGASFRDVNQMLTQGFRSRGISMNDSGLTVLHCKSIYPCPIKEANLERIVTLRKHLPGNIGVGYSDHTISVLTASWAVCKGAMVIEKHFREDGDFDSIDADHSITPQEFMVMVSYIFEAWHAQGNGSFNPSEKELHDVVWARRDPSDWLRPTMRGREGHWK
jgi:sialic acid synthase SpsE